MKIYEYTPMTAMDGKRVLALGLFDGVHLGHRAILNRAIAEARAHRLIASALTFTASSSKKGGGFIYNDRQRAELIASLGIDELLICDLDEIGDESAEHFASVTLPNLLGCRISVTGKDFRFGRGARGNVSLLKEIMESRGGEAIVVDEVTYENEKVSSTKIKKLLLDGKIKEANLLLGTPYYSIANTVRGMGLGHSFGFPTVNTDIGEGECEIKSGVYETVCTVDGKTYASLTNVGICPTVGERKKHRETYILGECGSLYEKEIRIEYTDFLREEIKFDSIDALREQIALDVRKITKES